ASGDALAHEADRRAVLAITDAGAAPADPEAPGQDRRQSVRRDQPDRSRPTRHFRAAGPARTRQAARVVAFFRCRTTCYQSFTLLTAELGLPGVCHSVASTNTAILGALLSENVSAKMVSGEFLV